MTNLDNVAELLRSHDNFLISTHVLPDGDGIGGELALAGYLKQLGKKFRIINHDPTPQKYHFLDPQSLIEQYDPAKTDVDEPEVVILIDCGDLQRIGSVGEKIKSFSSKLYIIDHHISENIDESKHFIDTKASSLGEMLYRFFTHIGADITKEMAHALYVSILTDTSSFRYSRTTSLSHLIAASLIDLGVKPEETYQRIYSKETIGKIRLLGETLNNIQLDANDQLAWVSIPKEKRDQYGATSEDTSSFIDYLMMIDSVEIGVLLREEDDGEVKVSFRSKGKHDVYKIAQQNGGGGHAHAAGVSMKIPLKEATETILKACKFVLEGDGNAFA